MNFQILYIEIYIFSYVIYIFWTSLVLFVWNTQILWWKWFIVARNSNHVLYFEITGPEYFWVFSYKMVMGWVVYSTKSTPRNRRFLSNIVGKSESYIRDKIHCTDWKFDDLIWLYNDWNYDGWLHPNFSRYFSVCYLPVLLSAEGGDLIKRRPLLTPPCRLSMNGSHI